MDKTYKDKNRVSSNNTQLTLLQSKQLYKRFFLIITKKIKKINVLEVFYENERKDKENISKKRYKDR